MGIFRKILQVSIFKTIYANFKLLPFDQALKLPIFIGRHTTLDLIRGGALIDADAKTGMICFGIGGSADLVNFNSNKSYFGIRKDAKVVFKGTAHFATHTSLLVAKSIVTFGDKFSSNNGCRFSCSEGIEFGNDCLLGGNVAIRDCDGHVIRSGDNVIPNKGAVKIGNHVWIANNVSILKGVTVADGSVIGYGSLVLKSLTEKNSLYAGSPAKLLKQDIVWDY